MVAFTAAGVAWRYRGHAVGQLVALFDAESHGESRNAR
jgi:hypothetical protein